MENKILNPLLENTNLIKYNNIEEIHIKEATTFIKEQVTSELNAIYSVNKQNRTFHNTIYTLDRSFDKMNTIVSNIYLLTYVHPDEKIRNACQESVTELSKFGNELSLNEDLYRSYKELADIPAYTSLKDEYKKSVTEQIEEFERNGFKLPKEEREKLKGIKDILAEAGIAFNANIAQYEDFLIVSEKEAEGLPDDYKKQHKQEDGTYKIGLSYPSYIPFMKYSKSENARKQLLIKYLNRATEKNLDVLKTILVRRKEKAQLLGYNTHAELALENKMAKTTKTVWDFEDKLWQKIQDKVKSDINELLEIKKQALSKNEVDKIQSWESSYYSTILLKDKYDLDQEKLKEYFTLHNVIDGLFTISQHLFDVRFEQIKNAPVWHPEVLAYDVLENEQLMGRFYLDLHPRQNKYNHAACFSLANGLKLEDEKQIPTATLVCNFPKETEDKPALIPHSDVVTFFHEFGHLLHHLFSKAELSDQAGISTARDFVEVPSQFFENWAWSYDSLKMFAKHYRTGEVLPEAFHKKMMAAKNVGSGVKTVQQIFYGMLDMTFHDRFDPQDERSTTDVVKELQNKLTPYPFVDATHMEASFGHLQGYAAGYYGYLWALVYALDCFSVFEQNGIMDQETGIRFKKEILSKGSTIDENKMLENFLGREPREDAFIKSLGL